MAWFMAHTDGGLLRPSGPDVSGEVGREARDDCGLVDRHSGASAPSGSDHISSSSPRAVAYRATRRASACWSSALRKHRSSARTAAAATAFAVAAAARSTSTSTSLSASTLAFAAFLSTSTSVCRLASLVAAALASRSPPLGSRTIPDPRRCLSGRLPVTSHAKAAPKTVQKTESWVTLGVLSVAQPCSLSL